MFVVVRILLRLMANVETGIYILGAGFGYLCTSSKDALYEKESLLPITRLGVVHLHLCYVTCEVVSQKFRWFFFLKNLIF